MIMGRGGWLLLMAAAHVCGCMALVLLMVVKRGGGTVLPARMGRWAELHESATSHF